jgi:hypothetical protein
VPGEDGRALGGGGGTGAGIRSVNGEDGTRSVSAGDDGGGIGMFGVRGGANTLRIVADEGSMSNASGGMPRSDRFASTLPGGGGGAAGTTILDVGAETEPASDEPAGTRCELRFARPSKMSRSDSWLSSKAARESFAGISSSSERVCEFRCLPQMQHKGFGRGQKR